MKITPLHIGLILGLIVLTADLRAAEGIDDWPLRIAIDDGTTDNELFVEFDHLVVESDRRSTGAAASASNKGRQTPAERGVVNGSDWRRGIAITVPLDAEPAAPVADVTISSDHPISENARNHIREILTSAGHGDRIEFVDSRAADTGIGREGDTM